MAGVAVIRLSGPLACSSTLRLVGTLPRPRQAARRTFRHPETRDVLDDGLLLTFPAPHSFTGEDVAEFHVHGSIAVIRAFFDVLGTMPGLRMAEPGEFTQRAFRNGRLDLVAAEGLGDLVRAKTERQRKLALHHALGHASETIESWRRELIAILARVEAAVDFTDEADVARETVDAVRGRLDHLIAQMRSALAEADRAAPIRDGVKVVIAGPPNAGKSSLLNWLAKREAAIVSAIPGTTRDVIEVAMDFAGLPVILTDTAGLRPHSEDEIERIGMDRTAQELLGADVVVWVTAPGADGGPTPELDSDALWIRNKSDLGSCAAEGQPDFQVSVKTGQGMSEFFSGLEQLVARMAADGESATLIRARHKQTTASCIENLMRASALSADNLELKAEALRAAAHDIGRLTGRIDVEEILGAIFREFCIGK